MNTEGLAPAAKGGNAMNQAWQSLSLLETLFGLGDRENSAGVRAIFNYPIKQCPELLVMGISQAVRNSNFLPVFIVFSVTFH